MDTFAFLVGVLLMLLSIQLNEPWLTIGILAVLIFTQKSLKMTAVLLIVAGLFYVAKSVGVREFWPWIVIGLAVVTAILSWKEKPAAPEFGADMLGGMGMEGMGGYGGGGYGGVY